MDKRCCFTGHRVIPDDKYVKIMQSLRHHILKLYTEGYTVFNIGGAQGFDTMAAQAVLKLKENFPDVQLHLYLPYPGQSDKWSGTDREVYRHILRHSDKAVYSAQDYTPGCINSRNRALVDNADICIAFCNQTSGGTVYTIGYALDNNVKVINIAAEI
ncbi:MAG: DUF1273 family protein [Oscillospiraceae bacterium]|nr:DUF1273 family protein [Oscillospiraceae bacterium]